MDQRVRVSTLIQKKYQNTLEKQQALSFVTAKCIDSLLDAGNFSTDLHLCKILEFIAACSYTAKSEQPTSVDQFEKALSSFKTPVISQHMAAVLKQGKTSFSDCMKQLIAMRASANTTLAVKKFLISDILTTETELVMRETVSRGIRANKMFFQHMTDDSFDLAAITAQTTELLASVQTLECMELWGLVAQRVYGCDDADMALFRCVVSCITHDACYAQARVALLMYACYYTELFNAEEEEEEPEQQEPDAESEPESEGEDADEEDQEEEEEEPDVEEQAAPSAVASGGIDSLLKKYGTTVDVDGLRITKAAPAAATTPVSEPEQLLFDDIVPAATEPATEPATAQPTPVSEPVQVEPSVPEAPVPVVATTAPVVSAAAPVLASDPAVERLNSFAARHKDRYPGGIPKQLLKSL
jgi:predicted CopG family antitoxin